jgi:formylglycine-generating enzyme required for sulfatase activity
MQGGAPLYTPRVDLVTIPGGWFWMGWEDGHPAERPRHRLWLDTFAIARAPVTNAEYGRFLEVVDVPPPPWWEDRASPIRSGPWSASTGSRRRCIANG